MIPQIQEINFGPGTSKSYATLHQATVSLTEMGDRIITTQVRIDGDVVPDFTGWELSFKGERFVLPTRVPQATKDNTTRNSLVDLTFQSWAPEQMKRYFFMSLSEVQTGVAIADQYVASVVMPVESFVNLFNSVLQYYFGNQIRMDLYQIGTGYYSTNPVAVEINYTYIWDVLTKFYELFNLRWNIVYDQGVYVIKVNYPAAAIDDHDFEYGYSGGLLKFERQVQDESITNILLGRGGEKNLPYRYFKKTDPQNPDWTADPDAVPELANIYFDRLRDVNFRWYVRGWMQNSNRDTSWDATHTFPQYTENDCPADYLFAFRRGKTDSKFNPVEYVKDDDSIAKYGERWGARDNDDDIYPTIQGIERSPIGRVDETVDISDILTDDIDAAVHAAAVTQSLGGQMTNTTSIAANSYEEYTFRTEEFTIPEDKVGNISVTWLAFVDGQSTAGVRVDTTTSRITSIYDVSTGQAISGQGIPEGRYYANVLVRCYNDTNTAKTVTFGANSITVTVSDADVDGWKPTFDIWVKNIWGTTQGQEESNEAYSARVWEPILGDRVGNEAKVVFSDGFMAVSEDYEFVIVSYPVPDRSKTINGVPSEWRITLRKSDAEYDSTGLFIPNAQTGGKPAAGDHFFFIGIDMPFQYVEWAEERLNTAKAAQLDTLSDINPTWVITLDKVRVNTIEAEDYGTALIDRLSAGCQVRTKDKRFTNNEVLTLYVQSITYTWNEPSVGNPYLVPDVEVVLSDKVVASESTVGKIQNDLQVIQSTYVKTADVEAVVRKVSAPLYLKKTGESDTSSSPTTFSSKISSTNFRQGDLGGEGWGHYEDADENAVLELDKLVVRKELVVNSLVVNQIAYMGGKQIISAAAIECSQVVEDSNYYTCYFDQKQGTVGNLFQVGDIAMGQTFDEDNTELRYYRCVVTAIGDNYIKLSKSQKDGLGAPRKGDVIVQYGNTSVSSRQYVILRDVIGGGYERMLAGLSSVTSSGSEYYFAGRQSGQTERWFVGNSSSEHAEYQNGVLNITGRLSVRKSDGTYVAMSSYIDNIDSQVAYLQDQIDGQIQSWAGDVAPLPIEDEHGQVDPSTANYPANAWTTTADRLEHMGDIYVDNTTGQGYRYTRQANDGDFYWLRISDSEVAEAVSKANQALEEVAGLTYLKTATNNGTLVDGGLVLTSLIQLGQAQNNNYIVYSGINGTLDTSLTDPKESIAAWYGGEMLEKSVFDDMTPQQQAAHTVDGFPMYAKSLFRFDGSGYLASGKINWGPSGSGSIPGISWTADNKVIISSSVYLEDLSGGQLTELITGLQTIMGWFEEVTTTIDGSTIKYLRLKTPTGGIQGLATNGFISAGGLSPSGGGGGGGSSLQEMWESLSGNSGYGANRQIDIAHLTTALSGYLTINAATNNYVSAVTINGNNLRVTKNNANTDLTIPYATTSKRLIRYTGTSESGGYDLDTLLAGGGITSQYASSSYWANAPTGMSYGSVVQINPQGTETLAAQFAWDITHNSSTPTRRIWWRAKNSSHAWQTDWHQIYDTASLTQSVITGLIGNSTYAPYNADGYLPLSGGNLTGFLVFDNAKDIQVKDSGGTARTVMGLNASNTFHIGYGPSGAGYTTNLEGNEINLKYSTSRTTGLTLESTGRLVVGNTSVGSIAMARTSYNYIWATGAGGTLLFGVADKGSTGTANSRMAINQYGVGINGASTYTTATSDYALKVTGNIITSGRVAVGTGADDSYLTSDTASNIYLHNSSGAVLVCASKVVRRGTSLADVTLGNATYPWGGIYSTTGNFTSTVTLANNVAIGGLDTSNTFRALASIGTSNNAYFAYGAAASGSNTYLCGKSIFLQYGTSHTTGLTLDSSGNVSIANDLLLANNKQIYISDSGETPRSVFQGYYSSSNELRIGYGYASAGYPVKVYGSSVSLYYGTSHTTGFTLGSDGNVEMTGVLRLANAKSVAIADSGGTLRSCVELSSSNNLLVGYGVASGGYTTRVDGNEIQLRYGTSHTTGLTLGSSGDVTIANNLILGNHTAHALKGTDTNGNPLTLMYLSSSNNLIAGYQVAQAGYNAYFCGNNVRLYYGTTPTIGFILNSSGKAGVGFTDDTYFYRKFNVNGDMLIRGTASGTPGRLVIGNGVHNATGGAGEILFQEYALASEDASGARNGFKIAATHATSSDRNDLKFYSSNNSTSPYAPSWTALMTLRYLGRVGILNETPAYALDVTGTIHSTVGIFSDGYVSAGGVSSSSDARLKTDLKDIDLTIDQIAEAPAITFRWKNEKTSPRHAGSIAQYWEKVMPETVTEIANHLALDYGATALLSSITIAKTVKNHEARIKELEEETRQPKAKVYALE